MLDGGTWEPGCAFKGGSDCIEEDIIVSSEPWFAPLPPPLVPLRWPDPWRVTAERRSYEGWCGGAMAAVSPASMLFGGGSIRRSVAVFLLVVC